MSKLGPKIIKGLEEAIAGKLSRVTIEGQTWVKVERQRNLPKRKARWTYEDGEGVGHLYYFAPKDRAKPPYTNQREVKAIIDIADDGTLAGVELVDNMPPPPKEEK